MSAGATAARACQGCGAELAPSLLACPGCRRLIHAAELSALAREAQAAVERGALTEGVTHWRSALALLPAESAQHAQLQQRIAELSARIEREGGSAQETPRRGVRGALGGAGA